MKTVLYNAKVYVEKGNFQEAVLLEDGLISVVGSNEEVLAAAETDKNEHSKWIDCGGRTLIPGLNDSHLHFMEFGENLQNPQIHSARSIDELIRICREYAEAYPTLVKDGLHAGGWNQDLFTGENGKSGKAGEPVEKRMPNRWDLDKISTDYPIVLERICGHVISVNSKALEIMGLAGRLDDTPHAPLHDGLFYGMTCDNARKTVPGATTESRRKAFIKAMQYAVAHGLTSVQSNDIGTSFLNRDEGFDMIRDIYNSGEGLLRYRHQMCFPSPEDFQKFCESGQMEDLKNEHPWLTYGPLKLFKDGSLGARTAFMRRGYAGDIGNHGIEELGKAEMESFCRVAKEHNIQVITHAIGDAAIEETLEHYKSVFDDSMDDTHNDTNRRAESADSSQNALRHGIVHCQITDKELVQRIISENVLAFVQPIFLDYDRHIVEELCGRELTETSYAFGTLLRECGARLSYSTDCPVEDCNPFPNIYMAVTRKGFDGLPEGGFYPDECVTVEDAIDAYTSGSAYAEFAEGQRGRIKAGFAADLVLLDRDIFTVNPVEIKDILPVMTIVGGKVVYDII